MRVPTTLSALVAREDGPAAAYGIDVDAEAFAPPPWLDCIALTWKADEAGAIDPLLLDTIVAYTLAGVRVIVEVAPMDAVDHADLLQLAGNAGFSVSVVPPDTDDPAALEAWQVQCEHFTDALLTTPNFGGDLFPITFHLSSLIAEQFACATAVTSDDPYFVMRFREVLTRDIETAVKMRIRAHLEYRLGGPTEVRKLLAALIAPLRDEAEAFLRKQVERQARNAP